MKTKFNQTEEVPDITDSQDAVVIGGGPAGLQAALTLGRVHRRVTILDDGTYRNAPVSHMHNVISRDGTPPAEFRAIAVEQLAAYDTVELYRVRANRVEQTGERQFRIELADGRTLVSRAVILATGVRDILPPIPGLADVWGDLAAQCPFCHGHEFTGQRVAILGAGPAGHLAPLISPITTDLLVLHNGDTEPEAPSGLPARAEAVTRIERHNSGLRLHFDGGTPEEVGGLFLVPGMEQSAPFAEQLGLELNPSGCVRIDERGRTSLPGVYAAGDMAHQDVFPMPMASVMVSAAAGMMAGATAVADLIMH